MRLYSLSSGIVLMAVAGMLAGGLLLLRAGNAQAGTATNTTRDAPHVLMMHLMNWAYADTLLDPADLPANPSTQFVVVDLRAAHDYAQGHLPGAVNVPPEFLVAHLGAHATDPERTVLLYGYSEKQSLQSLMALRLFAYKKVLHLRGGWPLVAEPLAEKPAHS